MEEQVQALLITLLVFFLIILVVAGIVLAIVLPITITRKRYINFVLANSTAIRELLQLNKRYKFYKVCDYEFTHTYDNEPFYNSISCQDYLIYQLQFKRDELLKNTHNAYENGVLYKEYLKEKSPFENHFQQYGPDTGSLKPEKLYKYEKKLFSKNELRPFTSYTVKVKLKRTNINGNYQESKSCSFGPKEIMNLINRLAEKKGYYYLDEGIWNAIVRVERGKVTNKMRFAIYSRDGYRCKMCGRKRDDLEIDHIIPIAKGGKTTMNNLQTLCHRCNVKKGASLDY